MSKHAKSRPVALSLQELRERHDRAAAEGRFQQALELAKQLSKQAPSAEHHRIVQDAYLGRARQLRHQGQTRDALQVLETLLERGSLDAASAGAVAHELAACGGARQALDLLRHFPGTPAETAILGHAADAAVRAGSAGRAGLPEDLRTDFDRVQQAFAQAEAGQDDAARATLQPIGLRSPFLEWRVMLRGLSAYYQQDDLRAVENWQRLDPERLPSRLIAPYRIQLDPAYRAAQPTETQAALQKQLEALAESGLLRPLRQIQSALAGHQSLTTAFRLAEGAVPALRQQAPRLVGRLASCFYWSIVHDGQPTDLPRYQRVFGAPADDPRLERLEALACEHRQDLESAHSFWKKYEKTVADNPAAWPAGQADHVRALIWCHMGQNAANRPDDDSLRDLPAFLRDHPDRPDPLKPPADECFRRSLELVPNQLEAHAALFHFHRERGRHKKAAAAARALLACFPEHVPTLDDFGDLCMELEDYAEAVALYQRALGANPLDRRLRAKAGTAHLFHARSFAEAGQFPEARAEYQAALAFDERRNDSSVLCKWAACEFKAGDNVRAEELLQQALTQEGSQVAVAYSMVIEAIRLKLSRPLKQRFDRELKEALERPATAAGAAAVAETTAAHVRAHVTYHGQKTHQKKVLTYLQAVPPAEFAEAHLERVCGALRDMKVQRQLNTFARLGQARFPNNPYFYFVEAQGHLDQGPQRCRPWKASPLLERARELAQALPPDDRQKDLLERIQQGLQLVGMGNPFLQLLEGFAGIPEMGDIFGAFDDVDDDWDDDDEDEALFEPSPRPRRSRRRR